MADFYLDHNVALDTASFLQARGHGAFTARGMRLEAATDDEHLLTASHRGWILVTHNRDDFVLLHEAWLRWSGAWGVTLEHAGILIVPHPPRVPIAQAAQELDAFVARGLPLRNELFELRSTGIWYRREPTGGWGRVS